MIKQPIPAVTAEDVERIVWRDFAPDEIETVMTLLGEYDESRQEPIRVRLAALKLADGDLEKLRAHIQLALRDYRDALAAAEYPVYMKTGFRVGKLAEDQKARIVEDDWRQYEEWMRR